MPLSPDRKLDALGVVLVVLILLGVALAVFGAIEVSNGGNSDSPQANFTVDRINETHLRLVHDGGDMIRGEDLSVTIDGRDRVPSVRRFPRRVTEGDAAILRVGTGSTLRVYYHGSGVGAPKRLDSMDT
ncbi:type IV pilin [Salinarchaeum laminariae]|uniref:type IV pilin n=1 Tax=Salinarchaeum laminariae TaxID=869888 RepID=UPI0020BD4BC2|nr:type IV pilin [Salinarchaeum laminariae]